MLDTWTKSVITVGDGRGFIVETQQERRYVITATHCLPCEPGGFGSVSDMSDRTYRDLLGQIGSKPTVWAECVFYDPVIDLAVLCEPDGQALWDENEAYEALVDAADPLTIAEIPLERERIAGFGNDVILGPPRGSCRAWLMSIDCRWFSCECLLTEASIGLRNGDEHIVGGMSGSPIVTDDGAAIGIVCSGDATDLFNLPQPHLVARLPGWFLRELGATIEMKTKSRSWVENVRVL